MALQRFMSLWTSPDYPPEAVDEDDLAAVEHRLGTRLPDAYRQSILRIGLPRPTFALLDAIVEHDLDLHSVGDFYTPSAIVEETLAWRAIGMPEQLIAFASDGCGNMFCFDGARLNVADRHGEAIWFYDHDY